MSVSMSVTKKKNNLWDNVFIDTGTIRKLKHIRYVENSIMEMHNEIFQLALKQQLAPNKCKLLRKYSKRLQLLKF